MADFQTVELNEGDVKLLRFRLEKPDNNGIMKPANLGVGATVKFVMEDLAGTKLRSATMVIVQDDDNDCIVEYELDTAASTAITADGRATKVYRIKLRAIRAGSKPETFPPGNEYIQARVGPNIDD
jgi:hypothetical protein